MKKIGTPIKPINAPPLANKTFCKSKAFQNQRQESDRKEEFV